MSVWRKRLSNYLRNYNSFQTGWNTFVQITSPAPDTTVRIEVRTVGLATFTNRNSRGWFEEIHLVAVRDDRVRIISDSWNTISTVNFQPIFVSGHGSGRAVRNHNYKKREWSLRLRDIPENWGALELRGKMAFGPHDNGVRPLPPMRTTKSIIDYIERTKIGLIIPLSIPIKRPSK